MKGPLVSIVMPVYNAEKFVGMAIESIINQTYTNWELIIVNDGSTDNSENVINRYLTKDKRIKYYKHNKNLGPAMAYNTGYIHSNGWYIAIQDADDVSLPYRLEYEVKILEDNPQCKLVFSPAIFIDTNNNVLSIWKSLLKEGLYSSSEIFYDIYINGNFIPNSSLLIRKPILKYDLRFRTVIDFFNSLQYLHDWPVYYIEKPLIKIRRGSGHNSLTSRKNLLFCEERIVLKDIYRLYKYDKNLAITFSIYRKAMSNQLNKEAGYFIAKGFKIKGKYLSIKSFIYNPFDKRKLVYMIENCFPSMIVKLLVAIKHLLSIQAYSQYSKFTK